MQQRRMKGVTLIELLIVIVIVGILAAIVFPSYSDSTKKTRRADAQSTLVMFSNKMEAYFNENNTFLGAAGTDLVPANWGSARIFSHESPINGTTKYYDLTIAAADGSTTPATLAPTATRYTLLAIPKGTQAEDGRLRLDSEGDRTWNSKDDGTGTNTDW